MVLVVKNLLAITGDIRDTGSIPGLQRFPRSRAWQPIPVFLPGESPWTEEPGGPQSIGSQRVGHYWSSWARISPYVRLSFQLSSSPWFHVVRPALISQSMWSTFSFYCTIKAKVLVTFALCEYGAHTFMICSDLVYFILFFWQTYDFSLCFSIIGAGKISKHGGTLLYINPHVCTDVWTQTYSFWTVFFVKVYKEWLLIYFKMYA